MTHDEKVEKLTEIVLDTYRDTFGDGLSDGDILDLNPSENSDFDPSQFYENLSIKLGLYDDDAIDSDGETIGDAINRIAEEWDGESDDSSSFEGYIDWESDDEITAEQEKETLNDGETFDAFDSTSGISSLGGDFDDLGLDDLADEELGDMDMGEMDDFDFDA